MNTGNASPTTSHRSRYALLAGAAMVLLGLLALALILSSVYGAEPGRARSQELADAYLRAVQDGDRDTLRGLFERDGWSYDALNRHVNDVLEKYAEVKGATFRATVIPDPSFDKFCYARITAEGDTQAAEAFKDDLWLLRQYSGGWALSGGNSVPFALDEELRELQSASDDSKQCRP